MRLYNIWRGAFFFRAWRLWISQQSQYSFKNNFITDSCYLSIELNAHSLLRILRIFRIHNLDSNMFCPWLFSSQAYEHLFRTARSMTSTFSTVINFSLKEFLHRLSRIGALNNIKHDLKDYMFFFQEKKKRKTTLLIYLKIRF